MAFPRAKQEGRRCGENGMGEVGGGGIDNKNFLLLKTLKKLISSGCVCMSERKRGNFISQTLKIFITQFLDGVESGGEGKWDEMRS